MYSRELLICFDYMVGSDNLTLNKVTNNRTARGLGQSGIRYIYASKNELDFLNGENKCKCGFVYIWKAVNYVKASRFNEPRFSLGQL